MCKCICGILGLSKTDLFISGLLIPLTYYCEQGLSKQQYTLYTFSNIFDQVHTYKMRMYHVKSVAQKRADLKPDLDSITVSVLENFL